MPFRSSRELSGHGPDTDALKAFGAAFATTSAAPMFHIAGVTPEARRSRDSFAVAGSAGDFAITHRRPSAGLARAERRRGWPGAAGLARQSAFLRHRACRPRSALSRIRHAIAQRAARRHLRARSEMAKAEAAGDVAVPSPTFGVTLVNDTCWCMVTEPDHSGRCPDHHDQFRQICPLRPRPHRTHHAFRQPGGLCGGRRDRRGSRRLPPVMARRACG